MSKIESNFWERYVGGVDVEISSRIFKLPHLKCLIGNGDEGLKMEDAYSTENESGGPSLCDLPPELLLKIFSYLQVSELCFSVSPVCRQLLQISRDASLWKNLEFNGALIKTEELCSILKRSSNLRSLTVINRGDIEALLNEVKRSNNRLETLVIKSCTASNERGHICSDLLISVFQACPCICDLTIKDTPFGSTKFYRLLGSSLPKLKRLNFNSNVYFDSSALNCIAANCNPLEELRVFRSFGFRSILPHCRDEDVKLLCSRMRNTLKVLKLNAVRLTDACIDDISSCHLLEILHLRCAVHISESALLKLARLQNLISLNISMVRSVPTLSWCKLFDTANWTNLKKLGLSFCSVVDDEVLNCIGKKSRDLEFLRLSGCVDVTDQGIDNIMKMCNKLKYINYLTPKGKCLRVLLM